MDEKNFFLLKDKKKKKEKKILFQLFEKDFLPFFSFKTSENFQIFSLKKFSVEGDEGNFSSLNTVT